MEAPAEQVKVRTSYNVAAISFDPEELAASIRRYLPGFELSYAPDFRQAIADGWPQSIDDAVARTDWGWKPEFDLDAMTRAMLDGLRGKLNH
jgi:nucleoside-diphosphate-sugar epimerase